jgi:four helix bundle protein
MGSGAELSYHLRLARESGIVIESIVFDSLRSNLTEIMRMLSSLSQKLKPRVEVVQLRAKS